MKVICSECDWYGTDKELLTVKNPFTEEGGICGCPECRSVNSELQACDEKDCWKPVVCGTPAENGYKNTCGKHKPVR